MMPAWGSILDRQLGASARAAVDEIAAALRGIVTAGALRDPSVSHGHAGLALFFAYRALATGRDDDRELALELLERSIAALGEMPLTGELFGGFPGIAWTAQHLAACIAADEDDGDAIEDAVLAQIARGQWRGRYGLSRGLVGLGVYALERLPRPGARRCVTAVIDTLAELGQPREEGIAWFTPPEVLEHLPVILEQAPDGCYEVGVADGIAGVVALLARAVASGVAQPRARTLLDGGVSWLLAHMLPGGLPSCFSRWVFDGARPKAARHAWCNGDPGVAIALDLAARATASAPWAQVALTIARKAALRPDERSAYVNDAGFCHGSAGLVHVFNRFYHQTGEAVFADAVRTWVTRTLAVRRAGTGIAGFTAKLSVQWDQPLQPSDEGGLLLGVAGIGLALIAATSQVEPRWDRLFLLSAPSGPAADSDPLIAGR